MTEYVDVAYTVTLNVHEDDVPTCGEIAEALWDQLASVYTEDAIRVERVETALEREAAKHSDAIQRAALGLPNEEGDER